MLFLTSNQHCQSTEGESKHWRQKTKQCEQRKMTNRHNIEQCYLSRRSYIALTSDQLYRWQPWPVTQPRASVQSAACVVHRRMYLAESNARSLDEPASVPLRTAALRCRGAFSCTQFTHEINTIGNWRHLQKFSENNQPFNNLNVIIHSRLSNESIFWISIRGFPS